MRRSKKSNDSSKLLGQINQLKVYCGLDIQNTSSDCSKVDVKRAYKLLKKITEKTGPENLKTLEPESINDLLKCCFFLITNSTFKLKKPSFPRFSSSDPILKVRKRFLEVLGLLFPEKFDDSIDFIMNYLQNNEFSEGLVIEIFKSIWSCDINIENVLERILNLIEELIIMNQVKKAECLTVGLSRSIDEHFSRMNADGLTRLLRLYHLYVDATDPANKFSNLKNAFESIVIKMFNNIKISELTKLLPKFLNLTFDTRFSSENALRQFSITLEYAFSRLSNNKIEDNLQPEIFEYLLLTMALDNKIKSLIACVFLTYLLDHYKNFNEFRWLEIFYTQTPYKIASAKTENPAVTKIIEDNNQLIRSSLLTALKLHGCTVSNLCVIFKLICMLIVSVPSPSTYTMIISMLLDFQSYLFDKKSSNIIARDKSRLHGFIISIMTLICWTTRAKSLTLYIDEIIKARANQAPYLNPTPIDSFASNDQYDVSYNSELFLDRWEIRYCLWNPWKHVKVDEIDICEDSEYQQNVKGRKVSYNPLKWNIFRRKSEPKLYARLSTANLSKMDEILLDLRAKI